MDGNALQRLAAARADELPGAVLEHPFGPETDVYKVRGKVFMLFMEVRASVLDASRSDRRAGGSAGDPGDRNTKGSPEGGRAVATANTDGSDRFEHVVNLKAAPADSQVLQEAYEEITPGYHMNKRHWITVGRGRALDAELLTDLVTESYLLVVEKLPRAQRPVNPATFGQAPSAH